MPNRTDRLSWEDPPARGSNRNNFTLAAAKLRHRKGEWAQLPVAYPKSGTASSVAFQIRSGGLKAFQPAGTYEAVARTVNGEHWVWARYLGEEKESERSTQAAPDGA